MGAKKGKEKVGGREGFRGVKGQGGPIAHPLGGISRESAFTPALSFPGRHSVTGCLVSRLGLLCSTKSIFSSIN